MIEKSIYTLDPKKDHLELIVKSKNKPGNPIYQEDLPRILFGRAPRIICGSRWFKKYSGLDKNGYCEGCHSFSPLERHELYGLYKWGTEYIIKLEGIMRICKKCHSKIHGKFSAKLNMKYCFKTLPAPLSDAMDVRKYKWNEAKFLLVEDQLYLL